MTSSPGAMPMARKAIASVRTGPDADRVTCAARLREFPFERLHLRTEHEPSAFDDATNRSRNRGAIVSGPQLKERDHRGTSSTEGSGTCIRLDEPDRSSTSGADHLRATPAATSPPSLGISWNPSRSCRYRSVSCRRASRRTGPTRCPQLDQHLRQFAQADRGIAADVEHVAVTDRRRAGA